MRVEPFTVGSYVHVVKRGARGLRIVTNSSDKWRFLRLLFYLNDEFLDENWEQSIRDLPLFYRPESWPERVCLVRILEFTLMPNHMHLLLQETRPGGVSMFMRKLGQSMTNHHNAKYKQKGSLFQGAYRSKTINSDEYLRYVAVYIMVKNTFELFPGGLAAAVKNFDSAWKWAGEYPFSSLGEYMTHRKFPIVEKDILGQIYKDPQIFKKFAHDVILGGNWLKTDFE